MFKALRGLAVLPLLIVPISVFSYDGPIIDGHLHISARSDQELMRKKFKANNVLQAVIFPREFKAGDDFGISEEGALEFSQQAPDLGWVLIGLQLDALHFKKPVRYWQSPPSEWREFLLKAEEQLISGKRKGMGELIIRHYDYHGKGHGEVDFPIKSRVFMDLMTLSNKTERPLVIHAEGEEHIVRDLLEVIPKFPKAKVVWAHACGRSNPQLVKQWLMSHPNLFCDLGNMTDTGNYGSLWPRAGDWTFRVEKDGVIESEWLKVLNQYPDRFYIGTDVNEVKGWNQAWNKRINRFRKILDQVDSSAREQIAYKTAQKLYGW
jgi:hypothetical protein